MSMIECHLPLSQGIDLDAKGKVGQTRFRAGALDQVLASFLFSAGSVVYDIPNPREGVGKTSDRGQEDCRRLDFVT